MIASCIDGPRLLPVGLVVALDLSGHYGRGWLSWWSYARYAFAIYPEDEHRQAMCEAVGECTAEDAREPA